MKVYTLTAFSRNNRDIHSLKIAILQYNILLQTTSTTKIEYFSEFFRKIADINPIYDICSPIYGDIKYLCTLLKKHQSLDYYTK